MVIAPTPSPTPTGESVRAVVEEACKAAVSDKGMSAAALTALTALLTLAISTGANMWMRRSEREETQRTRVADVNESRLTQRYDERMTAYTQLIDIAVKLRDQAVTAEYEREEPAPATHLDYVQLDGTFRPLRRAVDRVMMIATQETHDAADQLKEATESFVWNWSDEDYLTLSGAFIAFRVAARRDLGVEEVVLETAAPKPKKRERSSTS